MDFTTIKVVRTKQYYPPLTMTTVVYDLTARLFDDELDTSGAVSSAYISGEQHVAAYRLLGG